MHKLQTRIALLSFAGLLMAGCSQTNVGGAERSVDGVTKDAESYVHEAAMPLTPADTSPVQVSDEVWTSATARRSENGAPLPFRFENPGITITDDRALTLFELGAKITEATGIPVNFAADVNGNSKTAADSAPQAPAGGGAQPSSVSAQLRTLGLTGGDAGAANTSGISGASYVEQGATTKAMKVDFVGGPLSGVLNQVASYFGVTWSFDGQNLRFFRNITRTYFIHALPLDSMTMSNSTDASSSSNGGGGGGQATNAATSGTTQSAKSSVQIKVWDDVESGIKSVLGDAGKLSVSRSTGTITVTATAEAINEVQTFIDGQNAILSKQVTISVEVLNLQLTDSDQFNFSLNGVLKKYGLAAGTAGTSAAVTSTLGPALSYAVTGGTAAGSNAVLQALSQSGRVSVVTRTSLTTLNGIPAPLQVTHTQGYLAEVQTTSSAANVSGATQTSLTPGSVTYGYNLSLLPQVQPDSRSLVLAFSVNLSDLDGSTNGFDTFTTSGETIQLPNIISRDFTQQAEVPNGATLVLTGFEQQSNSATKSGAGVSNFLFGGGNQSGQRTRSVLVILLTPTVTSNSVITYQ